MLQWCISYLRSKIKQEDCSNSCLNILKLSKPLDPLRQDIWGWWWQLPVLDFFSLIKSLAGGHISLSRCPPHDMLSDLANHGGKGVFTTIFESQKLIWNEGWADEITRWARWHAINQPFQPNPLPHPIRSAISPCTSLLGQDSVKSLSRWLGCFYQRWGSSLSALVCLVPARFLPLTCPRASYDP